MTQYNLSHIEVSFKRHGQKGRRRNSYFPLYNVLSKLETAAYY